VIGDTWVQSLISAIAAVVAATQPVAPPTPVAGQPPAQVRKAGDWVGSWATAVTEADKTGLSATGVTNTTLRQVVHLSVGGNAVRIRLSNRFGTRPLVVGRTTAVPRKATAAPTPNVEILQVLPLTFQGKAAVTIPAGAEVMSDPLGLPVAEDSDLVISTYFPTATGPLTQHPSGYATAFSAHGEQTTGGGAQYRKVPGMARFVVSEVDVRGSAKGAVVLFGDSITDGAASPMDRNLRYPDQLADLLLTRDLGALNAGIAGNRLLANGGSSGEAAIGRFERDVVRRTGVQAVVVLEGINDIRLTRGAISATQVIAAHRQLIARAHAAGLKAYGATLTPFWASAQYTVGGEIARQAVNKWIRTSGEYDGVVDFEGALRNPTQPLMMLPGYDSGDHLHPNAAGFTAMARAFDLDLLAN
jgi:lysophospholipase L1-like esterase